MPKATDKQDLINDVKSIAAQLNKTYLTMRTYLKLGKYSDIPIYRLFKNWNNLLLEAGLCLTTERDYINDMIRVASILNINYLSKSLYDKHGEYSSDRIIYCFKNWKNAIKCAGLISSPNSGSPKFTTEQLIPFLKKFKNEFGYVPTRRDMEKSTKYGYPCDKVFYQHFPGKTWAEILALADMISPNQHMGKDGAFYDSIAEMKLANLLYSNFIIYEPHKSISTDRKWKCDFFLPVQNLWIEYDGLENRRLKQFQYQEKIEYYKNNKFNYLEIKEHDDCLQLCNLYLDSSKLDIKTISYNTADDFLKRVHYLGSATKGSKYYGGFIDTKLVGVICFGNTANPKEKSLAITRIAWLDIVRNDKNFGSRFISKVLKLFSKTGYSGKIVSWSDPRFHSGGLYKACNFSPSTVKKKTDYIYIDSDGHEFHKSYCRVKAGESEEEYAKSLGLIKTIVPAKQKWEIII